MAKLYEVSNNEGVDAIHSAEWGTENPSKPTTQRGCARPEADNPWKLRTS